MTEEKNVLIGEPLLKEPEKNAKRLERLTRKYNRSTAVYFDKETALVIAKESARHEDLGIKFDLSDVVRRMIKKSQLLTE